MERSGTTEAFLHIAMVNRVIRAPLIRLLKSKSMGLTQDNFDSESIKPSFNACSETENSEFDIFDFVYI